MICRVAECRQRSSIRLIVIGSVANGHAGGKHARASWWRCRRRRSIAPAAPIGASHTHETGQRASCGCSSRRAQG